MTGQDTTNAAPEARTAAPEQYLRIDEVAKRTGLTKRALRYYDELGLLEPAQRSEGNYRLYRLQDVETLLRIKAMRDLLGLELSEIRDIVRFELERERARAAWLRDPAPASRLNAINLAEQVTRKQLDLLDERLAGLERMRKDLQERLVRYEGLRAEIQSQLAE